MTLISSNPSNVAIPIVDSAQWTLRDPTDPTSMLYLNVTHRGGGAIQSNFTYRNSTFVLLGNADATYISRPIVVSDSASGEDGSLTCYTTDNPNNTALARLLLRQRTLLLRSPFQQAWYIRVTGTLGIGRPFSGGQPALPYREISFTYVEVDAPS